MCALHPLIWTSGNPPVCGGTGVGALILFVCIEPSFFEPFGPGFCANSQFDPPEFCQSEMCHYEYLHSPPSYVFRSTFCPTSKAALPRAFERTLITLEGETPHDAFVTALAEFMKIPSSFSESKSVPRFSSEVSLPIFFTWDYTKISTSFAPFPSQKKYFLRHPPRADRHFDPPLAVQTFFFLVPPTHDVS